MIAKFSNKNDFKLFKVVSGITQEKTVAAAAATNGERDRKYREFFGRSIVLPQVLQCVSLNSPCFVLYILK